MLKTIFVILILVNILIVQPQTLLPDVFRQPLSDNNNSQPFNQQDLEEGESQAKQASKDIYKGLKQAKDGVGKTQTRKEAMDYGHKNASNKLEDLAERAKAAQTPEDLNPVDRAFLKNLQNKV